MRLNLITEVVVADPDAVLGLLGSAARQLFGNGKKDLPKRYAVYTKLEADYRMHSTDQQKTCANCKYYDDKKCKIVEGTISPRGVCKFWDGG